MCEYCDLKKSEEYGGIYRGETMADREFFKECRDVQTEQRRVRTGEWFDQAVDYLKTTARSLLAFAGTCNSLRPNE